MDEKDIKIGVLIGDSEDKYKVLVEQLPFAVILFQDKKVVFANSAAKGIFGYKNGEDVLGLDVLSAVADGEKSKIGNYIERRLSGDKNVPERYSTFFKKTNGSEFPAEVFAKIVLHVEKPAHQVVIYDTTERFAAEKKMLELNKELSKTNRRLKQLALKDAHTGLYNHRYLEEVIEAELYRTRRYAHPLSVTMVDIDYFKSINEVYGHHFGDLVLKQLAVQLKKMLRKYDIVIRYGGEEFVIISPGTDKASALVLGQRILNTFNMANFGDKKHHVKLKLSIAVSSYPDDKIVNGIDLIHRAEKILDRVKEDGGNRVYSLFDVEKKKEAGFAKDEDETDVAHLKERMAKLTKQANQSLIESIFAFAKTIELKDHYTGEHVEKTVQYATEIAAAMGLPKEEIERIRQAAILHDLGKIGISERILHKRSKLSKREFEIIKKHPQIGADILRPIQFLHDIIPYIFYHHERWDGNGYPSGLKEEQIPLGARIIAMADVYQALTSDRPYRKALSDKEAIKIIEEGSGSQFDPKIADVFVSILEQEK